MGLAPVPMERSMKDILESLFMLLAIMAFSLLALILDGG